jgi:hypothetical protein
MLFKTTTNESPPETRFLTDTLLALQQLPKHKSITSSRGGRSQRALQIAVSHRERTHYG